MLPHALPGALAGPRVDQRQAIRMAVGWTCRTDSHCQEKVVGLSMTQRPPTAVQRPRQSPRRRRWLPQPLLWRRHPWSIGPPPTISAALHEPAGRQWQLGFPQACSALVWLPFSGTTVMGLSADSDRPEADCSRPMCNGPVGSCSLSNGQQPQTQSAIES
jgi:hypothetical protein